MPIRRALVGGLVGAFLVVFAATAALSTRAQEGPNLEPRAVMPGIARDMQAPARREPPPPGPGYCRGGNDLAPPTPPNAVFGLLTIGGEPAPAETLVTLTFDGHPGPSAYTLEAGGYKVNYAAGGQGQPVPCINVVGSEIGLLVNGVLVQSGAHVGDPIAYLAFVWDVAIP